MRTTRCWRFPLLPLLLIQAGRFLLSLTLDLLAVRLENAALSEVLRTVGEQAGVRVSIQGNLGNVQPQVLSGVLLPEGIKRLVENSNADFVMIYNRDEVRHRYPSEIRAYEGTRSVTDTDVNTLLFAYRGISCNVDGNEIFARSHS